MLSFSASEMARHVKEVFEAAGREPVLVTLRKRPRFVVMTLEDYAALKGLRAADIRPVRAMARRPAIGAFGASGS